MVAEQREDPSQDSHETDIAVSSELFAPGAPGVELCYQTFGDPDDEPLLLVMGLGGPMTWWDPALCRMLAERGFYVIRYDNRDTGRSTKVAGRVSRTMLVRAFSGRHVRTPYGLADMAADAFALLDHLGLESAHVAGVSMGGMIAQTMAIEQPRRVRSLTSIMSTTGKRSVGWQHPRLLPVLIARRGRGRTAYAEGSAAIWNLIGSPLYPNDPESVLTKAHETFDRGWSNGGVLRQMMAVTTQENRTQRLHARARAGARRARHRRPDGAPLRRPRHRRRDPGRRAAARRRHGPRPAAGPLRDLRRRHPPDRRPRLSRRICRSHVARARVASCLQRADSSDGRRAPTRLVGEALAGVGVEDVHVLRVGRDVDAVALGDGSRPETRTITLDGVPSTSQVP